MTYQTGNITGTFHEPDGITPSKGHAYLTFAGLAPPVVKDSAGHVVISGVLQGQLVDGVVTFADLPATDDPSLNPTGFGYRITVNLTNGTRFVLTTDLPAGSTVQLEDLVAAPAATFDPTVTYLATTGPIDGGTP